jgi:8-oxo-dGTP diphosphatase
VRGRVRNLRRVEPARYCASCGGVLAARLPHPVCTACGRVAYRDPKVGVGAVVRDGAGRLLLVQRGISPGKGLWALPAGYVDAGEDPRRAAAREVLEETGLVVDVGEVVDVYTGTGGGASFFLAFRARVLGGALAPGDDAVDARFFALAELPELAFESTRAAVGDAGR